MKQSLSCQQAKYDRPICLKAAAERPPLLLIKSFGVQVENQNSIQQHYHEIFHTLNFICPVLSVANQKMFIYRFYNNSIYYMISK